MNVRLANKAVNLLRQRHYCKHNSRVKFKTFRSFKKVVIEPMQINEVCKVKIEAEMEHDKFDHGKEIQDKLVVVILI